MNVASLIAPIAQAYPDAPALSSGSDRYRTYGELQRSVARLAGALLGLGLAPGDRVGCIMTNCAPYLEALLGIWHAGLVAVPTNCKLHPKELEYVLAYSGARLCFVTRDLEEQIAPLVEAIPGLERVICVEDPAYEALFRADPVAAAPTAPDDPAWIFFTSGTTGRPKGAMLTHRNLTVMSLCYYADVDFLDERDCMVHAAPLSHGSGLYALPHLARGSHQVITASRGFDPSEMFDLMRRYDRMTFFAAPTMLTRLIDHPGLGDARIDAVRTIFYGAAPMYVEDLKRALNRVGSRLIQLYGQGETPCTISYLPKRAHADSAHPQWEERLGSVGIRRTGVSVRIADAEDNELPRGEVGEILVQSDVTMKGYWDNPQATAETLRGGWLHTGDVGLMDESGFIYLKDRSKDMIISGGTNIYPREVEEVLLLHPAVHEVSVIGRPHPDWGEEVVAFVSLRPGRETDEKALDQLCLQNIARFKRPKAYYFIDDLPKSSYGKILKTELRERLRRGAVD